jgi:hypothetical protein
LKNLELIIQKILSRNKKPLLCGDWNLNFMVKNKSLQELQNLLESYYMINTVRSLTRITPSTESLIDGIITNNNNPVMSTSVFELGFSYHLAQITRINIGERKRRTKTIARRQFTYSSVEDFKHPLSKELWNVVYNRLDLKSSLEAFLDSFLHCFNIEFPYKRVNLRERSNKSGSQRD